LRQNYLIFEGMKNLIPILLAVVVLSGCDSAETSTENQLTNCGEIEHEGYSYSTVQIGEQCWFSENCRYLPSVSPSSAESATSPYYYVNGYQGTDIAAAKATTNFHAYGVLYNWPAVMTEGICPSGWHIPTDLEWQTMEMALGMSASEASSSGFRGSPFGDYMKSTSGWDGGENGSNSSGFTGLPGGYSESSGHVPKIYRSPGKFDSSGNSSSWWSASQAASESASESVSLSWSRSLSGYDDLATRHSYPQANGNSARCVRD
jgi:uncharacterized protein (TIGR02145 family)